MNGYPAKVMIRYRASLIVAFALTLTFSAGAAGKDEDKLSKATHTKVGDNLPAVSVSELSGDTLALPEKGKVSVVNFWATWCGPCQIEMPRLEKEIWGKYKARPDFVMVAIAREQTKDVVAGFHQKHPEYTFPLAYDPQRAAYGRFADGGIPRTYVVDRHGTIVFQSVGYADSDFAQLGRAIDKALSSQ